MSDTLKWRVRGEFFGYLDGKVKRALQPLKECIDRIVDENPDQFS